MFPKDTLILVIDDSNLVRESVTAALNSIGYNNLVEADDGQKAYFRLVNAENKKTPVGLVISDWNMPNMLGIDLLKKVRSEPRWQKLPFIMLTTEAAMNEVVQAVAADVSGYIVKPFDPKVLEEKMKTVWLKHNPAK